MDDLDNRDQRRRINLNDVNSLGDFLKFANQSAGNAIKFGLGALTLGLLTVGAVQSIYNIDPGHKGVVKRLGAHYKTMENGGPYLKIPYIDKVIDVDVAVVRSEEFGYRTLKAGGRSEFLSLEVDEKTGDSHLSTDDEDVLRNFVKDQARFGHTIRAANWDEATRKLLQGEYLRLTGDLNMIDVELSLLYVVEDPVAYLFNIEDPRKTLRDIGEYALSLVLGDSSIDEAMTLGKTDIQKRLEKIIQKNLDSYNSGIRITGAQLQDVDPPVAVRPYYNDINTARQDKEKSINEAWSLYNAAVPEAKGKADRTIREASADSVSRVNSNLGDTQRFMQSYHAYKKNPEITRTRMWLESQEKILPSITRVMEQKGAEGGVLQKLDLDKNKK